MTFAPMLAPNRARSERIGRAKGSVNYYTVPGVPVTIPGTKVTQQNQDEYTPWYASSPMVIDQIAFEVATLHASQNARIGFYAADGDMQPIGPPLADSGDISLGSTGVKTYTPSTPIYVPRGPYLSVINTTSNFTAALRFWSGGQSAIGTSMGGTNPVRYSGARTYAAFTNPGTVWTTTAATGSGTDSWPYHFVLYRVSAV